MRCAGVVEFSNRTLWTLIVMFICYCTVDAKRAEYPCPGTDAIRWVRDPNDCSIYYICHYGQPLGMPRCPIGQIWGNTAKNCVPEGSRWDDCNGPKYQPAPKKSDTIVIRTQPTDVTTKESKSVTMRAKTTESYVTQYNIPDMPKKTNKHVTPGYTVTGAVQFTVTMPTITKKPERATKRPRKTSPFTPSPIRRRFKPTSTPKLFTTKSNTRRPNKPRSRGSPFTPRPTTPRMILYTTNAPLPTRKIVRPRGRTMKPQRPRSTRRWYRPTTARSLRPTTPPTTPRMTTTKRTTITHPPTKRTPFTPWPTRKSPRRRYTTIARTPTTLPTVKNTRAWLRTTPKQGDKHKASKLEKLLKGHPCRTNHGKLIPHPKNCHWYFNCTETALIPKWRHGEPFVAECRYPQLFDVNINRCREFINVGCGYKFEPVDPCEYRSNQCDRVNCIPCDQRYGKCRGRPSGIYPFHTKRWTPTFVTCYDQRNIAQDDCQVPTPIFSPEVHDCVSLFEVPKGNGGLRPDCSFRDDGYYPDEQGRCGIFFECRDGEFEGYDECPAGKVFDPVSLKCQSLEIAAPPCGTGQQPQCYDRDDGFHADPFGRCTYYFECRRKKFIRYRTCDFGSFDPIRQECIIPNELVPRPCGLLPNPCETKSSGFFPDANTGCKSYIECSRGILIRNGTCPADQVFSSVSGKCDRQENAAEPCGLTPSCTNKKDGKYSALLKGCSFYYECSNRKFMGFKQCSYSQGGFFFNEKTGKCDFPQNICPPCGYKWWGCSRANSFR
ncbi:uncharacterized protein LOC124131378 [Haliotis rufescens]|uniref:uncharacterized protein LOC124131378 n=1 Tax=Haliotis rufescens TaxID=6454 RepID=UPI00201EAF19|nr:uncharacterized protein LOC124131378 [Haliotis rufescens]